MGLVQEILLQPRWDAKEFDLIKQSTLSQILQQKQINNIARNEYKKLIYGTGSILANNRIGTENSVNSITLDDLKNYTQNMAPSVTNFQIVGPLAKPMLVIHWLL
jgi:zinc protease